MNRRKNFGHFFFRLKFVDKIFFTLWKRFYSFWLKKFQLENRVVFWVFTLWKRFVSFARKKFQLENRVVIHVFTLRKSCLQSRFSKCENRSDENGFTCLRVIQCSRTPKGKSESVVATVADIQCMPFSAPEGHPTRPSRPYFGHRQMHFPSKNHV